LPFSLIFGTIHKEISCKWGNKALKKTGGFVFAVLFVLNLHHAQAGEPDGGIIGDLVFFDDSLNTPLIFIPSYSVSNLGPTTTQSYSGTHSLGGDWNSWAGIQPGMTHPDTSVFWIQPNSRLQFWTRASVANQPLRIYIRLSGRSPRQVRDFFLPGPNENEWYLVDIPLDSTLRNIPVTGFEIQGEATPHTRYLDDLKVTNVRLYAGLGDPEVPAMTHIAASQVGYAPNMRKQFSAANKFSWFQIVDDKTGTVVYNGGPPLRSATGDAINGATVWVGDFSDFTMPGRYRITTRFTESHPFTIGTDIFDQPLRAAQRMLYYQRAYTSITMPYAEGPWIHDDASFLAPPGIVGGWYEAGNYAVPLAPVTQSIYFLLSAWEDFRPLNDNINIPESNNNVPDILDEAKWGLRFVLSMQDSSGGFWSVCCPNDGIENYPYGISPPQQGTRPTDLQNYVKLLIGTPATAKAVAVLAHAAVVFREFDSTFANQCLQAATRGWVWLLYHPEVTPDDGLCAGYTTNGDPVAMASQRMWAAAAMLYATGDMQYHTAFENHYVNIYYIPSYSHTHAYAAMVYLRSPAGTAARKSFILSQFEANANGARFAGTQHPYGVWIAYYWGSLNTALESSANFTWKMFIDDLSRVNDRDQALESLHYIFGRNYLTKCYVSGLTGVTNGREEGFHHWMRTLNTTPRNYPGILSNGPNAAPNQFDITYPPHLYGYYGDPRNPREPDMPIEARYTDNDSWSTNELVISWNATLVYNLYAAQAVAKNTFLQRSTVRAGVKLLLGGAYNVATGSMTNSLRASGVLSNHFAGRVIPSEAVDSINIEIRNSPTAAASTIRMYQPAWLLRDGTVRSFNDTTKSFVEFQTEAGEYYLVVRHRSHLAIMSASSQLLSHAMPEVHDFTMGQNKAYGTNPMMPIGTTFALYPGDSDQSKVISSADANAVFGALNATGYSINDVNLSGIVSSSDASMIFRCLNKTSQVP
jgi:endoglucanase